MALYSEFDCKILRPEEYNRQFRNACLVWPGKGKVHYES